MAGGHVMVAYSFQKRFVTPIQVGLGLQQTIPGTEYWPKRQTIRAIGRRRHAQSGDTLQLYSGMRTKYCNLIGTSICVDVIPVIIWVDAKTIAVQLSKSLLGPREMKEFSRQDGFADPEDMAQFWRVQHKGVERFDGVVIQWRATGE
jgi:hypothetical protein